MGSGTNVRPAIRVGCEKQGKTTYAADYFSYLDNIWELRFFVYHNESIVGFALTKRNKRTSNCTISAIFVYQEYCSHEI